jgi:hypothetical protein
VVLFGQNAYLVPPFRLAAGKEFTLTAAADDKLCSITHWMVRKGTKQQGQSSLKLEDVLRTLAEMGADYADVVGLLRQVEDHKCLNCAVCVNALPQPMHVEVLAKSGTKAEQWGLAPAAKHSPGAGAAVVRPAGAKAPALSVVSDQ